MISISISKSNFKRKPALCEAELLLARNEEPERGMFERWLLALLLLHEERVTPFPNFER